MSDGPAAALDGALPGNRARLDAVPPGLELVATRPLVEDGLQVRIDLLAGDRVLVEAGEPVVAGTPLLERLRDAHVEEVDAMPGPERHPGERWTGDLARRTRGVAKKVGTVSGELLFSRLDRWRLVTGEQVDVVEAPAAGIVHSVRAGVELRIDLAGHAIPGAFGLGLPSRGVLEVATARDGELRPGALDVGRAGSILVVGSRIDAESLTRARAMGVRGVIVAALPGKDQRDFGASETRQRASLHRHPPFTVVVLDGILRRPIATAVAGLLEGLAGRDVALVADPPAVLFEDGPIAPPDPERVRVRHGPLAGHEGRWLGLGGPRRFGSGSHLESGLVELDDGGRAVAVALSDLERFT